MRELLLLRHGVTEYNEKRLFTGAGDIPLSEAGRRALEARRGDYPPAARFFTSGMLRTRQTLQILYGDVPSKAIADLAEYRFGDFEGRGHDDLYATEPLYRAWLEGDTNQACPGGESRAAFAERITRGWRELVSREWDGLAVLVAHGGVISTLMADSPVVGNGCGWRVLLDGAGGITRREAFL